MQVTVLLFGVLREAVGSDRVPLRLASGATVADARRAVVPASLADLPLGLSVNAAWANATTPLSDGDEVALLPPAGGG